MQTGELLEALVHACHSDEKQRAKKIIDLLCGIDVAFDGDFGQTLIDYGFNLIDSNPGQGITRYRRDDGYCDLVLYSIFETDQVSGELIKREGELWTSW